MNNNIFLQAADHLFSNSTLSCFSWTIVFLICYTKIQKHTYKLRLAKPLNVFIATLLCCLFLITIYVVFMRLSYFINHKRFNISGPITDPGNYMVMLTNTIGISFLFSIYHYLNYRFVKKINHIAGKSLVNGVLVFLLTNISMLCVQLIINNFSNTDIPDILAGWISGTAGCALAFMVYSYYEYFNSLKEQEKELKIVRLQQDLTRSQLDALSSKINPHFLYNTLNSIAGLAGTDGAKTRDMAIALSKLFRYNLNKEESNYVTVEDELEMVRTYLDIEKIRFDERLLYTIQIAPGLEKELIPRHLLQPLVENAVKHGGSPEGINIHIDIRKENDRIEIAVGDNGKPFDTHFNPGYGLKSLYDKLDLLTAGNYEIAFLTAPKAVHIRFKNNFAG